jgi:thiamine-phosphate pyrophosphorylase
MSLPRLMLVTDRRRTRGRPLVPLVVSAVHGGVGWVQLRERDLPDDELRALIAELRGALPAGTLLSVNSSLRVARTMELGLHLPAAAEVAARLSLSGPRGRSVHDDVELRRALDERVDYVVAGNVYETDSKPGRPAAGPALIERVARQAHPTPVYAIGGVTVGRVPALLHSGAHGIAVCGAVLAANDPERVAQGLRLAIEVACRRLRAGR